MVSLLHPQTSPKPKIGQKAALNLWYVADTRPNSQKLFPSIRSVIFGLQNSKNSSCLIIFFIHVIQIAEVNIHLFTCYKYAFADKRQLNYVN